MAVVNHSWPLEVEPLAGFELVGGMTVNISADAAGRVYVRRVLERPLPQFRARYFVAPDEAIYPELVALLRAVVDRSIPIWIAEPEVREHEDVFVGIGDGARATWSVPILSSGASGLVVYVDGDPVSPAHQVAANLLLTDDEARCAWSSGLLSTLYGTGSSDAQRLYLPAQLEAAKVASTSTNAGVVTRKYWSPGAGTPALPYDPAGQRFSVVAVVTPHSAAALRPVLWYGNSGSYTNGSFPVTSGGVAGRWYVLATNEVADATANQVMVGGGIGGGDTADATAAALALAPGDLEEWWLPSRAPLAVELTTPPASGTVVTARATGRRLWLVLPERGTPRTRMDSAGNLLIDVTWRAVRP